MSKVGILSLQGAYRLHADVLTALDAEPVDVRTPEALAGVAMPPAQNIGTGSSPVSASSCTSCTGACSFLAQS